MAVTGIRAKNSNFTLRRRGRVVLEIFEEGEQDELLGTAPTERVFSPTTESVQELKGRTAIVGCLAFSPDGKMIAAGGGGWSGEPPKHISLWDTTTGDPLSHFPAQTPADLLPLRPPPARPAHPHIHAIVTDGAFTLDGTFLCLS